MEEICDPERLEWYRMTPQERWRETTRLWEIYLMLGGSLDPEPDHQSPFYFPGESSSIPPDGRPGMRVVRRSGV
jgi:hypothetical protein